MSVMMTAIVQIINIHSDCVQCYTNVQKQTHEMKMFLSFLLEAEKNTKQIVTMMINKLQSDCILPNINISRLS